jgi:hypothetical protein
MLSPWSIRFSQNGIQATFKDGTFIEDVAAGLRSGQINPRDMPPIRLARRDGKLYTLDNRRLEAFRRAEVEVPARMATPHEIAEAGWKFTTKNDGESVRIRGL